MKKRHLATIALVLAVLFLPYWLYVPAVVLAVAFFPLYWEAVLLGFLVDVLYGARADGLFSLLGFRTAFFALLLVGAFIPVRQRLRWTR